MYKIPLPHEVRNLLTVPEEIKSDIDSDPDSSDDVDATGLPEFENLLNEMSSLMKKNEIYSKKYNQVPRTVRGE